MRRAPFVVAGTAAGLAGVLLFHPHPSTLSPGAIASAGGSTTGSGSSTTTNGTSGTDGASGSAGSSGTSSTSTTATYTGAAVTYSYGVLSVRITVSGHTITKVGIASLTDGENFRSQSIDEQAIPILEKEALSAQGANIQGVSGASYTSEGFASSLQSALSKAGL